MLNCMQKPRCLQTIARVQETASEAEIIDYDSPLVLIHDLKNEEARNRWIIEHGDDSVYNNLRTLRHLNWIRK
jgi:hypothetical protein